MLRRLKRGGACLIACLVAAPAAAEPAALVLEVSGEVEPALLAFSEIEAGTDITLAEDARLSIVHYGTCKILTLVGGSLRVDENRYLIGRSRVETERAQGCPRQVALEGEGSAAGVLMRGGDEDALPAMPLRPSFVFAGAEASAVARVEILVAGEPVVSLGMEGRRAAWPEDAPDLEAGTVYAVAIDKTDGSRTAYDFMAQARGARTLLILRLD